MRRSLLRAVACSVRRSQRRLREVCLERRSPRVVAVCSVHPNRLRVGDSSAVRLSRLRLRAVSLERPNPRRAAVCSVRLNRLRAAVFSVRLSRLRVAVDCSVPPSPPWVGDSSAVRPSPRVAEVCLAARLNPAAVSLAARVNPAEVSLPARVSPVTRWPSRSPTVAF